MKNSVDAILQYIEENQLLKANLATILEVSKNETSLFKALLLWELNFIDEAKEFINESRNSLGLEYYDLISLILKPELYELLLDYSQSEYIYLRTHKDLLLERIASEYLSLKFKTFAPKEKLVILTEIVQSEVRADYINSVFDMSSLQIELFRELDIHPLIKDEKTKMALEYALDPVPLILQSDDHFFFWMIESKIINKIESFWDSVKSSVINLTKNTVGNPTFRKYAIAGVALGVALASSDTYAGTEITGFDLNGVKEYFNSIDNYFNETILPKHGFNEACEVSSKIVKESSNQVSAQITIGDRTILIDVQSAATKGKGAFYAMEGIKTEVLKNPSIKTSCNMDKDTYINLAKSIAKQLSNFKK